MKKTILTCIALALTTTAVEARDISAGTLMLTGDTNLDIRTSEINYSGASETTDTTKINLASVYFVTENVGVGVLASSENTEKDDGTTVTKQSTSMIGPLVGYNISLNNNVSIMLHGSIFMLTGEIESGAYSTNLDGQGYMLGALVNYFVSDNVAANFGLRKVTADVDLSSGGTTTAADMDETGVSVGLAVFF